MEANMVTDKELEELAQYVAGSCQMGPWIERVLEREVTDEEEEQVLDYLHDMEIHECAGCGWWTNSGEGNGEYCDDCLQDQEDLEEDT